MSGKDRLRDKLRRLADEPALIADGWRRLGSEGPLAAEVTAEIDETILPRRLAFRAAEGAVLTVEAGHRRLRRFLPPCPDALAPWRHLFDAARLEAGVDIAEIAAALVAHFRGATEVWVRSEPLPSGTGGGQTGLSPAAVRAAWLAAGDCVTSDQIDPAEAVDDFLDTLARWAPVWVLLGDGAVEDRSDGAEALAEIAVEAWRHIVGLGQVAEPLCHVIGRTGGGCLVLAGDEERAIVAQLPGDAAMEVAAIWQALWT